MEKKTVKQLKTKGWSEEDIIKAQEIIEARHRMDKSRSIPTANRIVFWTIFVVIILANFLVSLTLIPFLLVLNKTGLDFIIVVIGLGFGLLFSFLTNISNVDRKHHIIAGIAIPIIALLNFLLMAYLANVMNSFLKLTEVRQNPVTISAVYVIAFIAPFLIDLAIKKYIKEE